MGLKEKLLEISDAVKRLPNPEAVSDLIAIASENSPMIAQHAIAGLGKASEGDRRRVAKTLSGILMDKRYHSNTRRACALVLGTMGPSLDSDSQTESLKALDLALNSSELDNMATINVIWALGELGCEESHIRLLVPFRDALSDCQEDDRFADPQAEWLLDIISEAQEKIAKRIRESRA